MDTHDAQHRTLAQQAAMLKELGYAGAAHLWLDGIPERLRTLDEKGLGLFQVYVRVCVEPGKPKYDPRLKEVIGLLKGRDTILGLLVTGAPPSSTEADPRAVEIVREIGDMAEASGLRVVLYPHAGDWLERVEDAVRVAKKVDRKNVGVQFNLCHWLKVDEESHLESVLKSAMPHLMVVTINGADHADPKSGWDRLIQPLDSGAFDVYGCLKALAGLGYRGPIGLQCYGIPGDVAHLARSMAAWRKLSARLAAERK